MGSDVLVVIYTLVGLLMVGTNYLPAADSVTASVVVVEAP
jgi:hypothetical protein